MLLAIAATVCASCHPALVRDYLLSPMGRSAGVVDVAAETPGEFRQEASRLQFRVRARSRSLELTAGAARMNLGLYVGSKRHGRSFVEVDQGFLYEAPVGYYSGHGWDMAPGYQNDREPDLHRPVTPECLGCHAGGVRFDPETVNRVSNPEAITGIGCERCHGEGRTHVASPRKENIVNPAQLTGKSRDSVCEQCHLSGEARVPLPGKRLEDFRPGERLASYVDVFVSDRQGKGISVNSHAEALAQSMCRIVSGDRIWCGSCHRVHSTVSDYRAICAGCHHRNSCPHAGEGECVSCHMPKGKAYDGSHTVFTDHTIPRDPAAKAIPAAVRLKRYYEEPRAAGLLARAEGLALAVTTPELAWPLLRQAVQAFPDDPKLLTEVAWMLQQSGRGREAMRLYRDSLAIDPWQNAALVNLAGLSLSEGDRTEAIRLLERALRMNPRQNQIRQKILPPLNKISH